MSSKLASWKFFLMGCGDGRISHVLCVSDTTLSAASMRARIFNEIMEGVYNAYIYYE